MTDYEILKRAFKKMSNIEEMNFNPTSYHVTFEEDEIFIFDEHGFEGVGFNFNSDGKFEGFRLDSAEKNYGVIGKNSDGKEVFSFDDSGLKV